MPKVRYCNDSRDSSFASCDFLPRQSSCISALHNLTRSCNSKNSETVSAYVCFHPEKIPWTIRWTQHRATGKPLWPIHRVAGHRHFDQSYETLRCKDLSTPQAFLQGGFSHVFKLQSRLSKCIKCQVFSRRPLCLTPMRTPTSPIPMALIGFDWLWPLWPIEMLHQKPRRQCCSGASNVCHPCLPRRGPKKCLHKKNCTRMFTPLEHMRVCTGVKIVCREKLMLS